MTHRSDQPALPGHSSPIRELVKRLRHFNRADLVLAEVLGPAKEGREAKSTGVRALAAGCERCLGFLVNNTYIHTANGS